MKEFNCRILMCEIQGEAAFSLECYRVKALYFLYQLKAELGELSAQMTWSQSSRGYQPASQSSGIAVLICEISAGPTADIFNPARAKVLGS